MSRLMPNTYSRKRQLSGCIFGDGFNILETNRRDVVTVTDHLGCVM